VSQYDVPLMHKIENKINLTLSEYKLNEKEILKILTEVSVTRSEAAIVRTFWFFCWRFFGIEV